MSAADIVAYVLSGMVIAAVAVYNVSAAARAARAEARATRKAMRTDADTPVARRPSELVAPGTAPYRALLELAVRDGRYAPALLEASLRGLLDLWQTATTGSEEPLRSVADSEALDGLLFDRDGPRRLRVVAHDLRLERWRLAEFDRAATPPTVLVELTVAGVHYRIDRGDAPHGGDTTDPHREQLWWRLALAERGRTQWRLLDPDAASQA